MIKRILIIIASVLVVALIVFLIVQMTKDNTVKSDATIAEESSYTPEPTEVPLPPHVSLILSNADDSFRESVKRNSDYEYSEDTIDTIPSSENLKVVFVYLDSKEDTEKLQTAIDTGVPVIVYNRCGAELPEGVIAIENANKGLNSPEETMEAAIAYPPHDTPVRLFGVFTSETSDAVKVWDNYREQGKVLSKGAYFKTSGENFSDWFLSMLDAFYPGMVDAVFCENPEYAAEIVQIMASCSRDDFEVFTEGTSDELTALAAQYPRILPITGKTDDAAAADAAADLIDSVIQNGTAESVVLSD